MTKEELAKLKIDLSHRFKLQNVKESMAFLEASRMMKSKIDEQELLTNSQRDVTHHDYLKGNNFCRKQIC